MLDSANGNVAAGGDFGCLALLRTSTSRIAVIHLVS
jgi:hypothetical protein